MIRKATIKDAELIATIGRKSFLEAHRLSSPESDMKAYLDEKFHIEPIEKELSDTKNIFHLFLHQDQPAGYSKIVFNCPTEQITETTNICKLERIYFLEEFLGKNLGSQFLNFNINLAKQNNQIGIWLTVWTENNRAVRFYEKYNFKTIGEIMFKVGNTYNPNYLMYLKL